MSDFEARTIARSFNMGDAIFADLAEGELFRFGKADAVYVKVRGGFRLASDPRAPKFKTGARAAVFRITAS